MPKRMSRRSRQARGPRSAAVRAAESARRSSCRRSRPSSSQLNRDYDVQKKTYESLLARRESATMGKDVQDTGGAQFRVIDPPRVRRNRSRRTAWAARARLRVLARRRVVREPRGEPTDADVPRGAQLARDQQAPDPRHGVDAAERIARTASQAPQCAGCSQAASAGSSPRSAPSSRSPCWSDASREGPTMSISSNRRPSGSKSCGARASDLAEDGIRRVARARPTRSKHADSGGDGLGARGRGRHRYRPGVARRTRRKSRCVRTAPDARIPTRHVEIDFARLKARGFVTPDAVDRRSPRNFASSSGRSSATPSAAGRRSSTATWSW